MVRDASQRARPRTRRSIQAKADAEGGGADQVALPGQREGHELRTPLNAIIGFSDIMRSKLFGPLSERYAEYAGLIHESGGHLLDLINDVLDMSKIEADRFSLSLEPFDAREAVSSALRPTPGPGRHRQDPGPARRAAAAAARRSRPTAAPRHQARSCSTWSPNSLKFTPARRRGERGGARERAGELEDHRRRHRGRDRAPVWNGLGKPYEQAGGAETSAPRAPALALSLVARLRQRLHGGVMVIKVKSVLGEGCRRLGAPACARTFRPRQSSNRRRRRNHPSRPNRPNPDAPLAATT